MRLIGSDFLTVSLGDVVRRICVEQVEIEIDPAKFKGGVVKEKELQANMKLLKEWVTRLWNSIYDARQSCPKFVSARCCSPLTSSQRVPAHLWPTANIRGGQVRGAQDALDVRLGVPVPALLRARDPQPSAVRHRLQPGRPSRPAHAHARRQDDSGPRKFFPVRDQGTSRTAHRGSADIEGRRSHGWRGWQAS